MNKVLKTNKDSNPKEDEVRCFEGLWGIFCKIPNNIFKYYLLIILNINIT